MTTDQIQPQVEPIVAPVIPHFDAQEEAYKRRSGKSNSPTSTEDEVAKIDLESSVSDRKETPKTESDEVPEKEEPDVKDQKDVSDELLKLKKKGDDARSYASDIKRRFILTQSKIKDLIESGDLEEEAGKALLEAMSSTAIKEPDDLKHSLKESQEKSSQGILSPLYKNFTEDLLNQYLEVSEDEVVDNKIRAFDSLVTQSSEEEQKEILERILEKGKTPMSHLKAVLALGQEFLDDGFGEYLKAGSFKKYTNSWKEKQADLEEKVDKLQRKLIQYESNFDRPDKMNLGGSMTGGGPANRKFDAQEEAHRLRQVRQRLPL